MKVMVDKDPAELYEVKTRNLNEAVGRNLKRFPEILCFNLPMTNLKTWCSKMEHQVGAEHEKLSMYLPNRV